MPYDILVLDDDALICMASAAALRAAGYAVAEAEDAGSAIALLRRHRPRLMVADIDLGRGPDGRPGPSGLDVAAHGQAMLADLAVIFATGRPQALASHQFGARASWIGKPFAPNDLVERAYALIGQPALAIA